MSDILVPPQQTAPVAAASGGTLATGTYYYVVTALFGTSETTVSNEELVKVTGPTGEVTVNWNAVPGATGYNIYRGTVVGGEKVLVGTASAGSTNLVDAGSGSAALPPRTIGIIDRGRSGFFGPSPNGVTVAPANGGSLAPNTTYFYVVTAVSAAGESFPSGEVSGTTGAAQMTLNRTWNPVTGAVDYNVYRSNTSGQETLLATVTSPAFLDQGAQTPSGPTSPNGLAVAPVSGGSLTPNTTYYYVVTALDAAGESLPGSEVSAKTSVTQMTLNLTWSPVAGATAYNVYRATTSGQETLLATVASPAFSDQGALPLVGPGTPAATTTVFNGYGVIGNAAGVGTSTQVDLMKVHLQAGDALTVQLNTSSILSPLKPVVRIFDANGDDLTTNFQDSGQVPFGSLNSGPLGLRQFDTSNVFTAGNNLYLPPAPGQPGDTSDLNYTFVPVLAPPQLTSITPGTSTGYLTSGATYYYEVTAYNASGQTIAGNQLLFTATASHEAVLNWNPVAGAAGYVVYRGSVPGQESFVATVAGGARTT
ncbi:MAG TPA: hypothetical protein PK867_00010 [Pirellulales bacterium]|nr:hypothetical protein [Pirellulales bacterium]